MIVLDSARFRSGEEHDDTHAELAAIDGDMRERVGSPEVQPNGVTRGAPPSGLYAETAELRARIGALETKIAKAGLVGIAIGTAIASIVERWVSHVLGGIGG